MYIFIKWYGSSDNVVLTNYKTYIKTLSVYSFNKLEFRTTRNQSLTVARSSVAVDIAPVAFLNVGKNDIFYLISLKFAGRNSVMR